MLVCRCADPQRASADVIAMLVAKEIIVATPTDCVWGGLGYAPGPRIQDAVEGDLEFLRLKANGLEVRVPDRIELFYTTDGGEPWVSCPDCDTRLAHDVLFEHLTAQDRTGEKQLVRCAACESERTIEEFDAHKSAFGNLAFYFWNWSPLREAFMKEIKKCHRGRMRRIIELM